MEELILLAVSQTEGAPPSGAAGAFSLVPMLLIFAVFYFLIIRPQQKRTRSHRDLLSRLKKDDEVVTTGGLIGKITAVGDDNVLTLQIADRVRVRVLRGQVADLYQPASPPDANKG